MGIKCEINLQKSSDGIFRPGMTVAGSIKYTIDKKTEFKKITISLKGRGNLHMQKIIYSNNGTIVFNYYNNEEYVRQDYVIYDAQNESKSHLIGNHEAQFIFTLPEKIPPSFSVRTGSEGYDIKCKVQYFVCIKFEKASLFSSNNKYRKDIAVCCGITPKLPTVPTICGEEKTLKKLFSTKTQKISLTANFKTCVIQPGGKLEFDYKVANNSNVTVKEVKTKVMEAYHFTSNNGKQLNATERVKEIDSIKSGSVNPGEVKTFHIELMLPLDKVSVDFSKMVVKDFIVRVTANLPIPHRDIVVNMPFQVGVIEGQPIVVASFSGHSSEPNLAPPSYWEVMSEDSENTDEKK